MMTALIYVNTLIFCSLSLIHFYWAIGGTWGAKVSIPSTTNAKPVFNPSVVATLVVAFGLLFFALVVFSNLALFNLLPVTLIRYGTLGIAFIFFLRTIGDFNYVGLFKQVKGTKFAIYDNQFYVPLCAYLAISCLLIIIFGRYKLALD